MKCSECGNELKENMMFCNKCGAKIGEKKNKKENARKIKFKVSDVVNQSNVLNATNKVAYIANGWALQVKKRGENLAIIVGVIYFIMACMGLGDALSYSDSAGSVFFTTFIMGVIYCVAIVMVFNTVAFIIRMGAEVIQLLEDIKNK